MAVGLYIHVPFCLSRCHFCAFSLRIHRPDWVDAYLGALTREIDLHADAGTLADRRIETVYFGGGTPTTLAAEQLCAILSQLRRRFAVDAEAEISVEAHPDTVDEDKLRRLVEAGFTRLSLGMQASNDEDLTTLGRPGAPSAVRRAVACARTAGFANLNLDVIYGQAGQTLDRWDDTLADLLSLSPTHASCYALTVEPHSHLAVEVRRGDAGEPDAGLQVAMEHLAAQRLADAGFARYELSNYARPGFACRHNLLYWQSGEYVGLGPSAQSYLDGRRFGNIENLDGYRRALDDGAWPWAHEERLDAGQRLREAIVFGLRTAQGVDREAVRQATHDAEWHRAYRRLADEGLVQERDGRVRLTESGRRFADDVAVALI